MNVKHFTISSFGDLNRIIGDEKIIHLRKFVSKKALKLINSKCRDINFVSVSEKLYLKNKKTIDESNLKIVVIRRGSGRPNLIEKLMYEKNMDFSMKFKSIGIKNKEVFV